MGEEKQQKTVIHINPPPRSGRCQCCGKHISELKPFGGKGDPLVGDFTGSLLVKNFRALEGRYEKYEKILAKVQKRVEEESKRDYEDFEKFLIEEVGEEKAQEVLFYDQVVNTVEASWECRDCIVLDGSEFYDKRLQGYHNPKETGD